MPDPFHDLANLSHTYAAEDFMAQRKRLREARARWIDEHECPTASTIEHTDAEGKPLLDKDGKPKVTALGGPFQTGIRRYDQDIPAGAAPGRTNFEPSFAEQLETVPADKDGLDELLSEARQFMAPGIYRESPHPEIREGESYGEYHARVAGEYERQTGANAVRRPVPDSDSVREPAADDSRGDGGLPATGTSTGGEDRANDGSGGQPSADDPGGSVERGSPSQHGDAGDGPSERPGATADDSASGSAPGGQE
jgi:hypothetical protein